MCGDVNKTPRVRNLSPAKSLPNRSLPFDHGPKSAYCPSMKIRFAASLGGQESLPATRDETDPTRGWRNGLEILAVDTDRLSLTCAKLLLERQGHRVTTAGSGEAALEHAQVRRYDLVLLELVLPGLSGEQTALILRDPLGGAIGRTAPIIALSALTGEAVRRRCLAAGMDAFLPKPMQWEELQHAIRITLLHRGDPRAA